MKKSALALFLIAGVAACDAGPPATTGVGVTRQAITGCEPGPFEVSVYINDFYGGSCANLGLNQGFRGAFDIPAWTGLPNDSITSLKLGSNVYGMFFKDSAYRGPRFDAESSYFNVGGYFNDSFTSAIIQTWDRLCTDPNWRPGPGQVALYADSGYGNTCLVLDEHDDLGNGPGRFFFGSAGLLHMTGKTSSMRVGPNTRIWTGRTGWPDGTAPEEVFDRDVFDMTGTVVGNDTIAGAIVNTF